MYRFKCLNMRARHIMPRGKLANIAQRPYNELCDQKRQRVNAPGLP